MTGRWFRDVYRDAVWESPALKAAEKAVAETYARHARDKDGNKSVAADLAWITYERLMEKAGIGRRAGVSTAVTRLVDLGWLKPVQQVSRRATVYRLTIPVAGSSEGGTTEQVDAHGARSSDGETTVVPLLEPGSSASTSGSSDGGTQPLGPSKELTISSLSPREENPPAPNVPAPRPERETEEASQNNQPDNPIHRLLLDAGCPRDQLTEAQQWVTNDCQPRGLGWWRKTAGNGDLKVHVAAFLDAAAQACPDCNDTGQTGDWMNPRQCSCTWWKDPAAARKAFVAQLKDFPDCAHGVAGGDLKAPNGWQHCASCRGPGWVDKDPKPRTEDRTNRAARSTGVLRATQALQVAARLDGLSPADRVVQNAQPLYAKYKAQEAGYKPYRNPPDQSAYLDDWKAPRRTT